MPNKSDDQEKEINQYFPTYHFKDPTIAIKEYEGAAKTLEAEEKILTTATQMTALIAAAVGYIVIGYYDKLSVLLYDSTHSLIIVGVVALGVFSYSLTSLRYLADRQRAIVFAARKVIVLRRMLGIDYGT